MFTRVSPSERRTLRASLGLPDNDVVAVFVGRLSREKGVMELLEAWAGLDLSGIRLVLVGPDMPGHPWDVGREARSFVTSHGLEGTVHFAGAVPREQVAPWLQAADLAVQPSHFEAFGISAAEAMAAGLPVVATDVGGLKDFVEHGVNGFRVPSGDPAVLRATLRQVLSDGELRKRLGDAARTTAARFAEHLVLEGVAVEIDRLAAGVRAPQSADEFSRTIPSHGAFVSDFAHEASTPPRPSEQVRAPEQGGGRHTAGGRRRGAGPTA